MICKDLNIELCLTCRGRVNSKNICSVIQWKDYINTNKDFDFSFRYRGKQDHAGLYFTLSILKLIFVEWSIYDNRHWDYEKGCFQSEAVQYSNACELAHCRFNGFNLEFLWDDAKDCLRETKYMRERVLNSFGKYRKCPGDHNADFVHQRIGEHFREVDGSLREMEEWLEKLTRV